MQPETVRMWRPAPDDRVLLLAGQTTRYAVQPRGEYVFGTVDGRPMRSRRGRERRVVGPGALVAWDPSQAHAGAAIDGRAWSSRLIVVEVGDLHDLASDSDDDGLADVLFPEPVVADAELRSAFVRLHVALEAPTTRLERDALLADWLRALIERTTPLLRPRPPRSERNERAFRAACEYLGERPDHNVALEDLAAVAGVGKFRLIRLFRERTGLPPHALQIAHRVRRARRMLEAGATIAETAAATGFADQSHLHRHFLRSLGMTPGAYRRRAQAPAGVRQRPAAP